MFSLTATKGLIFRIGLVLGLVFATVLATTPAQAYMAVARGTYIVQVKDGTAATVRALISKLGETPHDELTEVMDGFVLDLTDAEVATLRADANVIQVVADQPMSLMDSQSPAPSWGLDRIDQTNTTYDNTYNYPASAGAGVRAYIVDTGVMATDPDFAGRIETGVDMLGQNLQGADCNGHGTHVAGTVAGTKYGVAKKATIIPVRVLGCTGSGTWSGFISAIDWIIANHPAGTPGVMNASLGGGKYQLVNDAVQKLYAAGITPVVAAGNSNADACASSPSSSPNAITVGASDNADARASFSNFGDCVDVFAPGVSIISNNFADATTPRSLSGTSMASPHVAGLAALYLGGNKTASPATVAAAIQAGAQAGVVVDAKSAAGNYLINTRFTNAALPPVGAPTAVTASAITSTGATISWTAPAGTQAATGYKVEYRESTATAFTSLDSVATTISLTALKANTTYSVRVSSVSGSTTSPASGELVFSTLGSVPEAPTNLRSTAIYGSQVSLAWDAPSSANGSKVTGYELWMQTAGVWALKQTGSSTIASVNSLTANTAYSFRVLAVNSLGVSQPSNVLAVTTTAATPTVVVMTTRSNLTASSITINWNPVSAIDASTPITYRVVVTNTLSNLVTSNSTVSTNSVTLTGLTRYTTYSVVVTALSGAIAGPPSNPYTFRTLADVPTAVTNLYYNRVNDTQLNIIWQAPRDNGGVPILGFKVEKLVAGTWTLVATNADTVQNLIVTSPAPGAVEQYRVYAFNSIGSGLSTTVNLAGIVLAPQPPTNLAFAPIAATTTGSLTWSAPTNTGGAPISGYTVRRSADGGAMSTLATGVQVTNFTTALPPKGVTYTYVVLATNSGGNSLPSTSVSYSQATTVPSAPASPSATWAADGTLLVTWRAPADNGGSAITSYKLQRLVNNVYTTLREGLVLQTSLPREAPGASYVLRVIATNAVGEGLPSTAATFVVPLVKASAPRNLVADTTSQINRVVFKWDASENAGGSTSVSYRLEYSTNGTSWVWITSTSLLSLTTATPPKGTTYSYRVLAQTAAGNSDPSNLVSVTTAATKASNPSVRSVNFGADGNVLLTWSAPGDNGGSAITGYRVESSADGQSFTTLTTTAANVLSAGALRPAAGQRIYFRVFAINALGDSIASSIAMLQAPFTKASAPQNFTAVDMQNSVKASWEAPSNLGGSTYLTYQIQVSRDGGSTWSILTSVSSTSANLTRPAKGTTWQYRVASFTSFGLGETTAGISITAPTTVAGAPLIRSFTMNADQSMTLVFNAPSDLGGVALTGYRVERSANASTWRELTTLAANAGTLVIEKQPAGTRIYVRVIALNSVGASLPSSWLTLQTPFTQASAVQNLTATPGPSLTLRWQAPSDLGGSTSVSYYRLESSTDGVAYTTFANSSGLVWVGSMPAKGTSLSYRVSAVTNFGFGLPSNVVSATSATTAPSSVTSVNVVRNNANQFTVNFSRPSDLGGLSDWSYRILGLQGNASVQLATGVGANANSVQLTAPALNVYGYFQIIASNAKGDSITYMFMVRG